MLRLYLVGLVLRLVPVLLARGLGIGLDDMFQYDMLARSLASGNGYRWYAKADLAQLEPYVKFDLSSVDYDPVRGVPTSFRAPLYPTFLALVYSISGTGFGRFLAARLAQAVLLGAPLAPLTYLAARRLLPGQEKLARASGWIVACYPMLLLYPLGLGTENLFFLLVLASFLALLRLAPGRSVDTRGMDAIGGASISRQRFGSAQRENAAVPLSASGIWDFVLAGLLLGLAALTRSVILPFAGLAVLWAWFLLRERRGALIIAAVLALTIAPWVTRNSLLHGKLTGIETSLGYNLYVGYHPKSDGSFTFGPSLDLVPILDDAVRDRLGTQQATEFIRQDPGRLLPLALSRLGHFFRLELRVLAYFYSSNFFGFIPLPLLLLLAAFFGLPFGLLSLSAAFGATKLPRSAGSWLLGLLFLGYLPPHVFILSEERFHLALVPMLAMVAPLAWVRLPKGRALVVAGIVAALLLANWSYQFYSERAKYEALLGKEGNRSGFPY